MTPAEGAPVARVVRLGPGDTEAVLTLERAAQQRPWSPGQVEAELAGDPDRAVFGATAAGARSLLGWLALRRMVDEAWILQLGVDPAARRRGIASALVEAAASVAGEWGADLWLEVRAGNAAARALYERLGFEGVATRKGYYPPVSTEPGTPREDAVLMRRSPQR